MDLIPREALEKNRGGSYFISDKSLEEASDTSLRDFSILMDEIAKEYPNLYFGSTRHNLNNGYIISWWVRDEYRTDENGNPKVLPWR